MSVKVNIAGHKGTVDVAVNPGSTVLDVLLEAAGHLGHTDASIVERLSPVVDGEPAELGDVLPEDARVVTAAPAANNG